MDDLCYFGRFFGLTEEERLEWDDEELTIEFLDRFTDEEITHHSYLCSGCRS
jgi:hypothetical protein